VRPAVLAALVFCQVDIRADGMRAFAWFEGASHAGLGLPSSSKCRRVVGGRPR